MLSVTRYLAPTVTALALASLSAQDAANPAKPAAKPAAEPSWNTNIDKAKAAARKDKLPILAAFVDPSDASKKLQADVFGNAEFTAWAGERVVLLSLDFSSDAQGDAAQKRQNERLKKDYKITAFPTVVFVDVGGKELGRIAGPVEGGVQGFLTKAGEYVGGDEGGWITSWDEAVKRSKKSGKPILADFTGSDWCGWCIKLKGEVFDTPEFQKWAASNVVLLELDFPRKKELPAELKEQNQKLQQKYGITGYPTILVLDAAGEKLGKLGYMPGGPEKWTAEAEKFTGKGRKKG